MPSAELGRYRLLQSIAQGGMAEIFLARMEGPGGFEKTVVIKRMHAYMARDPEFTSMFMNEARLVAQLSHPNIVQVLDFGELDGAYFLCMEHLVGGDLSDLSGRLSKRGQALPFPVAAVVMSAVCDALAYAHSFKDSQGRGVRLVHRDISPQNIFVTTQGAVKVLDFGIVKMAGRGIETEAGIIKGKPYYLSPEQIRGKPLDGRSDLFALGAVLYELVTGVRPFERDDNVACMRAILDETIPLPRGHRPDLPEALEKIIMTALEREVERRFENAQAMRIALDRFAASCTSTPPVRQLQAFMADLESEAPNIQVDPELKDPELLVSTDVGLPAPAPPREPANPAQTLVREIRPPDTHVDLSPMGANRAVERESTAQMMDAVVRSRRRWLFAPLAAVLLIGAVLWYSQASAPVRAPSPETIATPIPAQTAPSLPLPAPVPPEAVVHVPAKLASLASPRAPDVPPAAATPRRSPVDASKPAGTRSAPSTASASAAGLLDVNCVPWCQVWVDSEASPMNSPVLRLKLPAGAHRVKVHQPDTGAEEVREVRLEPNDETRVIIRF